MGRIVLPPFGAVDVVLCSCPWHPFVNPDLSLIRIKDSTGHTGWQKSMICGDRTYLVEERLGHLSNRMRANMFRKISGNVKMKYRESMMLTRRSQDNDCGEDWLL